MKSRFQCPASIRDRLGSAAAIMRWSADQLDAMPRGALTESGRDWVERNALQSRIALLALTMTSERLDGESEGSAAIERRVSAEAAGIEAQPFDNLATAQRVIRSTRFAMRCLVFAPLEAELREWGFASSAEVMQCLAQIGPAATPERANEWTEPAGGLAVSELS